MESLQDRINRERPALERDRAKNPEQAPGARMGRGVHSEGVSQRTVDGVRAYGRPQIDVQPERSPTPTEKALPVRDPTQHVFAPPGFSMSLGPMQSGMLAGTRTSRQGMLDHWHAKQAERQTQPAAEPARPVIDRAPSMTVSDMRPILSSTARQFTTNGHDRDDHERGGR